LAQNIRSIREHPKRCLICNIKIKECGKYCSRICYYISEGGKPTWNKGLSKELQPRFGRVCSEEMKQKISNSERGRISEKKGLTFMEMYGEERGLLIAKKHSETLKIKGSCKGKRNSMWKGGISYIKYPMEFNNILKKEIRTRDNNHCKICGKYFKEISKSLNVHHIDYNKQNTSNNNLITLCSSCHSRTNANRFFWKSFLLEKVNG